MGIRKYALLLIAIVMVAGGIAGAKGKIVRPSPRPESLTPPGSVLRGEDGPEVPFPLSASLPFPWNKIQGIWEGRINGKSKLFSFEVKTDVNDSEILAVSELDGASGLVLSEGFGIAGSDDNLVRAAMYGVYSGDSYMLFIGSYRNTKVAKRAVTVLTIRSFGEVDGVSDQQLVIKKLSSVPYR